MDTWSLDAFRLQPTESMTIPRDTWQEEVRFTFELVLLIFFWEIPLQVELGKWQGSIWVAGQKLGHAVLPAPLSATDGAAAATIRESPPVHQLLSL